MSSLIVSLSGLLVICLSSYSSESVLEYADDNSIVHETKIGDIIGNVVSQSDGTSIYEFRGIRYAQAPIGDLRFKPAIQLKRLSEDGSVYNASNYKFECIQPSLDNFPNQSEDCLFLNIVTPSLNSKERLPVVVFIFGGSFTNGGSQNDLLNGRAFVNSGGNEVIFVGINYRLGPFGFMSHPQIESENILDGSGGNGGMNGILDQIVALRWIQDNIKQFGGDPSDVTIMGQSAGGISICSLLFSPLIKNERLFKRVNVYSGACTSTAFRPSDKSIGELFSEARITGPGFPNDINILRTIDARTLLFGLFDIENPFTTTFFFPAIDDYVLTDSTDNLLNSIKSPKDLNAKSIKFAFTSLDGLATPIHTVGTFFPTTDEERAEILLELTINDELISEIINVLYPNVLGADIAWYQMNSDFCFVCPTYDLMSILNEKINCFSKYQRKRFVQFLSEFRGIQEPFLAFHGQELPFVFKSSLLAQLLVTTFDEELSERMIESISDFIIEGSVNEEEWIPFNECNDVWLWDTNPRLDENFLETHNNGACIRWQTIDQNTRDLLCLNGLTTGVTAIDEQFLPTV
jgi:carboxylesterase type B